MDICKEWKTLPITHVHHPRMIHSHLYMMPKHTLPHMEQIMAIHSRKMDELSPLHNTLHREQRHLTKELFFLLGHLDEAAAYGDLTNCVECLDYVDNVTTSLRGLCETEYLAREAAKKQRL